MAYRIFTDSTADLTREMLEGLPTLVIIPLQVMFDGGQGAYTPDGDMTIPEFYALQKQGNFASTSQINPQVYCDYFIPALEQGLDVLYLGFSSGLSGCIQSAQMAAEELRIQYPERRITCLDTLCASVGEGFLVLEALERQAAGMSMEELTAWVKENWGKVCHWFTVDTFDHLKHGGRVSTASAVMGTMLNIKPLLHVDEQGKLAVVEKPRGQHKAMEAQLNHMKAGWVPEMGRRVVIGHGDDLEKAHLLQGKVLKQFPDAKTELSYIGPVIGAHTGPGMLALIYWGNNR